MVLKNIKMQNAKMQTSSAQSKMRRNVFGAVKNARSERWETVAHGSNLTAEKWSVLVGIVQTNTGHFVYVEIFVILCVKKKATREIQTKLSTYYKEKKEDKNMQVTATVKIMGEEASGISAQIGNPWKSRMILLKCPDFGEYGLPPTPTGEARPTGRDGGGRSLHSLSPGILSESCWPICGIVRLASH